MPIIESLNKNIHETINHKTIKLKDALLLSVAFYYPDESFWSDSRYNVDIKILMRDGNVYRYDPFCDGGKYQFGKFGINELKDISQKECFYEVCKWRYEWIDFLLYHLENGCHSGELAGFPLYTLGLCNMEIMKICEDNSLISLGVFNEWQLLDSRTGAEGIVHAMYKYTELFWGKR